MPCQILFLQNDKFVLKLVMIVFRNQLSSYSGASSSVLNNVDYLLSHRLNSTHLKAVENQRFLIRVWSTHDSRLLVDCFRIWCRAYTYRAMQSAMAPSRTLISSNLYQDYTIEFFISSHYSIQYVFLI